MSDVIGVIRISRCDLSNWVGIGSISLDLVELERIILLISSLVAGVNELSDGG